MQYQTIFLVSTSTPWFHANWKKESFHGFIPILTKSFFGDTMTFMIKLGLSIDKKLNHKQIKNLSCRDDSDNKGLTILREDLS